MLVGAPPGESSNRGVCLPAMRVTTGGRSRWPGSADGLHFSFTHTVASVLGVEPSVALKANISFDISRAAVGGTGKERERTRGNGHRARDFLALLLLSRNGNSR